jgi:hypothetical protein
MKGDFYEGISRDLENSEVRGNSYRVRGSRGGVFGSAVSEVFAAPSC